MGLPLQVVKPDSRGRTFVLRKPAIFVNYLAGGGESKAEDDTNGGIGCLRLVSLIYDTASCVLGISMRFLPGKHTANLEISHTNTKRHRNHHDKRPHSITDCVFGTTALTNAVRKQCYRFFCRVSELTVPFESHNFQDDFREPCFWGQKQDHIFVKRVWDLGWSSFGEPLGKQRQLFPLKNTQTNTPSCWESTLVNFPADLQWERVPDLIPSWQHRGENQSVREGTSSGQIFWKMTDILKTVRLRTPDRQILPTGGGRHQDIGCEWHSWTWDKCGDIHQFCVLHGRLSFCKVASISQRNVTFLVKEQKCEVTSSRPDYVIWMI